MEMKYSNTIINKYINQTLLPHLWEAIRIKQIEKNVQRHMPHAISHHMMMDLLDSTAKNGQLFRRLKGKKQFAQIQENKKDPEDIKIRMKKSKKIQSTFIKIQYHESPEKLEEERSVNLSNNCNNSLVKLPNTDEEQCQEVIKIRKLKERMRRFQNQIKKRGELNANFSQESARKKKSAHSQCKYHTYDYYSNILPVQMEDYNDSEAPNKISLLECLKKNLDNQIQEESLSKKLEQIENKHKKVSFKVPSHKIQKIDNQKGSSPKNSKSEQKISTPLKPLFKFQLSNIESLSKKFQDCIEDGVKMVTNQEKIFEEAENPEGPRFKIKQQKFLHEKVGSPKQKTHSNQSIIYSLGRNLINSRIQQNKSEILNKNVVKHQSLQLNREEQESKLSQYYNGGNLSKQIKSTLNTPASHGFKLPEIRFNNEGMRIQKKRTATEQKMIKCLDHIEIECKSPHKSQQSRLEERSGLYSAFSNNKKTESSIQSYEFDKFSVAAAQKKKSFIKDYFNNYGNQFRFRRQLLQGQNLKI